MGSLVEAVFSPSPPFCNGAGSSPLREGEGISRLLYQLSVMRPYSRLTGLSGFLPSQE